MPCDPTSKESCGFRVSVAGAKDLESRAPCGTHSRRPPGVRKWHDSLKLHAIKGKKKKTRKERKKKKTKPLKIFGTTSLAKLFCKETNHLKPMKIKRKVAARSALREDGSLLDFSFCWSLQKQGDFQAGVAFSVRANPLTKIWAFQCPHSSSLEVPRPVAPSCGALLGNLLCAATRVSVNPHDCYQGGMNY